MDNDIPASDDASVLLGLDGLAVEKVQVGADGVRVVFVVTACGTARGCPECGVVSTCVKEWVTTSPRDLACGGVPVVLVWRKRRWSCREAACPRRSFTEQVPQVPARSRLTGRLRSAAGRDVADAGRTVVQAGRDHGLSWPVVMQALAAYAARVLPEQPRSTRVLGIDEVRRGRPQWRRDEYTGTWRLVADCWHVGFVDAAGGAGLFGQVEGRTGEAVRAWLQARPASWKQQITHVAIDMCTVFRTAVRAELPHARIVADAFHLVQMANRKVGDLRRRLTFTQRGRRGKTGDPEWEVRGLLVRNREDLSRSGLERIDRHLGWMGTRGRHIKAGWHAKELLRRLLRLTSRHAGRHPSRSEISNARYRFQAWCADHGFLPELVTLASNIDRWWDETEAYILTGITNAASEGNNRLIKLEARNAFGFRNRENQRLRSRCATTRRARRQAHPD